MSKYPCCGQSRFEPVKRGALDCKVWWSVYDNKEKMWRPGHKYRTRRGAVLSLLMNFRHGSIPFEPDDERRGLKWLRSLTSLDQAMCRATRREGPCVNGKMTNMQAFARKMIEKQKED